MRVKKVTEKANGEPHFRLLDEGSHPIEEVEGFLRHLAVSGYSPNTIEAYAYELLHFYSFLSEKGLGWDDFTPALSLQFLEYLKNTPSRNGNARRLRLALVVNGDNPYGGPTTRLFPATINRAIAAVSSFYEYLIVSGRPDVDRNPVQKKDDLDFPRFSERPEPFFSGDRF
jgi:site-specific recombinase XerD